MSQTHNTPNSLSSEMSTYNHETGYYEHPHIGRVRKVPIQRSFSVRGHWHGMSGHVLKVEADTDGGFMIATAGWEAAVFYTNLLLMVIRSNQDTLSALLLLHERQPEAVSYAINFTSDGVQDRGMVDLLGVSSDLHEDRLRGIRALFLLGYYPSIRLTSTDCLTILTDPFQLFSDIRTPTIDRLYSYLRCVGKIPSIEEIARYLNDFVQRIHPVTLKYRKVIDRNGFVSYVTEREQCLLHSHSLADNFFGVYERLRGMVAGPRDPQADLMETYPEKIAIRLRVMDLMCNLLTDTSDAIVLVHAKEKSLFDILLRYL